MELPFTPHCGAHLVALFGKVLGEFEDLGGAFLYKRIQLRPIIKILSSGPTNPVNSQECTVNPTVHSIGMDANSGGRMNYRCFCGPLGWTIR